MQEVPVSRYVLQYTSQQAHDVIVTSTDVDATSVRLHFDIMCPLGCNVEMKSY